MFGGKHKKSEFRYVPRYYDEEKEKLRKRVRAIQEEMGEVEKKEHKPGSHVKGAFTVNKEKKKSEEQNRLKRTNIKLIIIIFLLAYLAWYLYTTDYFQNLLENFNNYNNGR